MEHTERTTRLETKVEALEKSTLQEHDAHFSYKESVHKKLTNVHNRLNVKDLNDASEIKRLEMGQRDLNHTFEHQDEALKEFKEFIKEAKTMFTTMNDFMVKQSAKDSLKSQLAVGVVKLAGFTATIIGIIKYLDK